MWIAVIVALVVVAALLVLQFRSGKTTAPVDIEALERASDSEVTPFTVHVEEEVLDDLRTRLSLSRYPPEQEVRTPLARSLAVISLTRPSFRRASGGKQVHR